MLKISVRESTTLKGLKSFNKKGSYNTKADSVK